MAITPANFMNLRDGRFDSTSRDDLRRLFTSFTTGGTKHLAVHFHGGLVGESSAMAMAERLLPEYQQTSVCHPIFVVWESGLLETIRNNAGEVAKEAFFQKLLKRVLAFAAGKVLQTAGQKGVSVTPVGNKKVNEELTNVKNGVPSWTELTDERLGQTSELSETELEQFRDILERDAAFMNEAVAISNSVRPPATADKSKGATTAVSKATLMSPSVLADIKRERDSAGPGQTKGLMGAARLVKGGVVVVAKVIGRFASQRDHGFHATVVEEIFREFYVSAVGREVWGLMKQDTADAFHEGSATFGGSALLEELAALTPRPRVTLIGHSAGAEYVMNLLANAGRFLAPDFTFDVILLAPACRTKLFADTLSHFAGRIGDFRCFTMDDAHEKADQLIKVIYPHSLLYFISGVLEDGADEPILGMQRYLNGGAAHYQKSETGIPAAKAFLEGGANRLFFAVSNAGAGFATDSISHGGFDDTVAPAPRATIDSIRHILKNGF